MRALTLALLLAGCGGKTAGSTTTPVANAHDEHGEHGEHGEGDEHAEMTPEMKRFHNLLQPRWHAPAGPERQKATCDAIADFQAATDVLKTSTPPQSTNADSWTAGTKAVTAAMVDLAGACANGKNFDTAFQKVHDAFHSLMVQGEHGEGGGGSHGEHEHGEPQHGEHGDHDHGGGT